MKKIVLILYFLFLFLFTFFSYLFIDPNLIYLKNIFTGFAFLNRYSVSVVYFFLITTFFVFYLVFLKYFKDKNFTLRHFKLILIITIGGLIFSYPAMLSYDIFNYIFTSKVLFFYHENPYIIMPIQFIGDPLLLFTHAANKIALYGPFWILLTGISYLFGFGNFLITTLILKIMNVIFYILTTYLIYKISRNIYMTAIFALNPLAIIETLVSCHNDIVMMGLALASIILLQKKKYLLGLIILILSILIKYSTIFLIPIFIYLIFNKIKEKNINTDKFYLFSGISMGIIFFLSPIREEMYPWYAIWFLPFVSLIRNYRIVYISNLLSFGLLLSYLPYMFLGTYFGITPIIKNILIFIFPIIYIVFNLKIFFRNYLNK